MNAMTLKIAWKYLTAFLKSEWELSAYPLRLRHFRVDPTADSGRLKPRVWNAQSITWWLMSGHGETPEEAMAA